MGSILAEDVLSLSLILPLSLGIDKVRIMTKDREVEEERFDACGSKGFPTNPSLDFVKRYTLP
jgi:hypothetical protein